MKDFFNEIKDSFKRAFKEVPRSFFRLPRSTILTKTSYQSKWRYIDRQLIGLLKQDLSFRAKAII
jgi:hypothetical protein